MPQTKKKPEPAAQPVEVNGGPATTEVLTLAEAAAYLRLAEPEVERLIHEQGLPARKVGSEWRFLKAAIQHWLATGSQPLHGSKEAWLSLAGSCKDDPDLEAIVEEAYRKRGRPITEDGSYKNFSR
jgi:excisionase family DNA binding protein